MSFKSEYKALNETGTEALNFWQQNHVVSKLHEVEDIKDTINKYFKNLDINACCMVGTMEKSNNFAFLICTKEPSYKMIDRVEYKQCTSFHHLIDALELIGIKCHK